MLKEVAVILAEIAPGEGYKFYDRVAGEIDNKYMARFKEVIGKLTVINDEEWFSEYQLKMAREIGCSFPLAGQNRDECNRKAQLQHNKKELLGKLE